jgi:hypothetical protein
LSIGDPPIYQVSLKLMGGSYQAPKPGTETFVFSRMQPPGERGVVPILLGAGLPLFPAGFPQRDFTLVENRTYSKNQIALTYRRVRSKRKRK